MHRADLLGPAPFWFILVLLLGSGVANAAAYCVAMRMQPSPARMHVRLSVGTLTTLAILYSTGWGAVIAIGFVLAVSDVLRTDGSDAWWRGTLWSVVAIGLGQLAIAVGLAPSVLSLHISNAVALGNADLPRDRALQHGDDDQVRRAGERDRSRRNASTSGSSSSTPRT